jgi:hypothetical protein
MSSAVYLDQDPDVDVLKNEYFFGRLIIINRYFLYMR